VTDSESVGTCWLSAENGGLRSDPRRSLSVLDGFACQCTSGWI